MAGMASREEVLPSLQALENSGEQENAQQFCNICLVQNAKYTCPRCNVRYCALACYQSERHTQCSEGFYKECVVADLKQTERSPEDRQRMMEMLQRFESENNEPIQDKDIPTLEERLAGLDIENDGGKVWDKLTPLERKEFHEMIKNGTAGHLLESYTPWWETVSMVTPLEDGGSKPDSSLPPLPVDLPALNLLIKNGPVSETVKYSVINALYAYAYTLRFFNGGHRELPLQACQALMDLSPCVSSDVIYTNLHEAVRSTFTLVQQSHHLFNSHNFSLSVLEDVSSILCNERSHDCHVTIALCDVHSLMGTAHDQAKNNKRRSGSSKTASKKLWLAKKKVYFFMVWSKENTLSLTSLRQVLLFEIGVIRREQEQSHDVYVSDTSKSCTEISKLKLIEEIV